MVRFFRQSVPWAAIFLAVTAASAHAVDEIQVYNAEIAKVGQWTMQLHLNYAFIGRREPDFEGGLIPHHALNGTPEWAYGITGLVGDGVLCALRGRSERKVIFQ